MNTTELARGLFQALESGDFGLATAVVAKEFHNREASVSPTACALPGPAGVVASSVWMRSAFSNLRFPILGIATNDDQVWVRLRMQGLQSGPFVRFHEGSLDQAIPPTGKKIDFEQIHTLTVSDGNITGHEAVRDDVTMLSQLGVFPPSPAVALRMIAWKVTGRAARAADLVSGEAAAAAKALQNSGSHH
ncbi:ester cyclase [Streptomyces sp. NPDC094458]|uniref:ester cyclase n=1 Tax=Streptomyces sp. NPDC094458 TaxID=3155208 RepID=UPI00331CEEA9